jgi:hypothetical protein
MYLWILLTVLEACFAAPGLIELSPSAVPAIVSIAGVILPATVNALLGLDSGYRKATYEVELDVFLRTFREDEREFQQWLDAIRQAPKEEEILDRNRQTGEAKALWSNLQKQLDEQKQRAETAHANAVDDFRGWLYSVRKWVEENPEKIAEFVKNHQPHQ